MLVKNIVNGVILLKISNKNLLREMPVYVKDRFIAILIVLIFSEFFNGCIFFEGYGSTREIVWIIYFIIFSLAIYFFFRITLRNGSFVLSADEKGVYYKVINKCTEFVLIEWDIIKDIDCELDDGTVYLHVRTVAQKINEIPLPCHGTISNYKNLDFHFALPSKIKGTKLKIELEHLRVRAGKAKFF
jgi:hypothetical protein